MVAFLIQPKFSGLWFVLCIARLKTDVAGSNIQLRFITATFRSDVALNYLTFFMYANDIYILMLCVSIEDANYVGLTLRILVCFVWPAACCHIPQICEVVIFS